MVIFVLRVGVGERGVAHISQAAHIVGKMSPWLVAATVFPGWSGCQGIWEQTSGNTIPEVEGILALLIARVDTAQSKAGSSPSSHGEFIKGEIHIFLLTHHTRVFPEKSQTHREALRNEAQQGLLQKACGCQLSGHHQGGALPLISVLSPGTHGLSPAQEWTQHMYPCFLLLIRKADEKGAVS